MTKILIIEDEPDIRETLAYNFKNEGFKVMAESSGEKALTLSKSFEPDIIILDLMLPDISGIDVCKKIKNSDEYPDPSIIMLTAKGEEVDKETKVGTSSREIEGVEREQEERDQDEIDVVDDAILETVDFRYDQGKEDRGEG